MKHRYHPRRQPIHFREDSSVELEPGINIPFLQCRICPTVGWKRSRGIGKPPGIPSEPRKERKVRTKEYHTIRYIVCAYLFLDFPRLNHFTSFVQRRRNPFSSPHFTFLHSSLVSLFYFYFLRELVSCNLSDYSSLLRLVARVETILSARNAKTVLSKKGININASSARNNRVYRFISLGDLSLALHLLS